MSLICITTYMKSLDLSEKTFGYWTVLRLGTYHGTHKRWWCKCRCGTEGEVLQTSLVRGASKSCGCRKNLIGNDNPHWNGCGELTGSQWALIRNNAKHRGIPIGVSIEEAWELFLTQNRICRLSGLSIGFSKSYNRKLSIHARAETTASLDRIDSSKGYVKGNVQWVHKDINLMKRSLSEQKFLQLCQAIVKFNQ